MSPLNLVRFKRGKITRRFAAAMAKERPLVQLAESISKTAREALNEASMLVIEEVEVYLDRLPPNLDGLRIAHLSDVHHSPLTDLDHIAEAVRVTNELSPDLVVLTGDYVSHEHEYIEPMASALGGLRAKHGLFACLGNHDHWTDADAVAANLNANGIRVLNNEGLRIEIDEDSFWLAGVDDHLVGKTDLVSALEGSHDLELKLLLAHNPVVVRQAVRHSIDLVFSGHTHGGQVRLRSNEKRLLPRMRLTNGLHRRKGTQIYITRGIGTVVAPVRYQCPPEISLLTLKAS
jgi:predicted MPP superfamily phosphohydrolase